MENIINKEITRNNKSYLLFKFKFHKTFFFILNIIIIIKIIDNLDNKLIKVKLSINNNESNNLLNNNFKKMCKKYKKLSDRNKCIYKNKQKFKKEFKFKNYRESKIYLDNYETNILDKIKKKIRKNQCFGMWDNQQEFLNGAIRKFKPKKIVEIGVSFGGSSIIILNAINNINDSHLYSIDLSKGKNIGQCVKKFFQIY